MRSGRLPHRVAIQERATTQDAAGAPVYTLTTLRTVWAGIYPQSGAEGVKRFAVTPEITHVVEMRVQPDLAVTPNHVLLYGSRLMEIKTVMDKGERGFELEIHCVEQVNG